MGFYISAKTGRYYEGDRADRRDEAVMQRPGPDYQWIDGGWEWVDPMTDPDYARKALAEQEINESPLTGITYEDAAAWIGAVFDASFGHGRDCSDPAVLTDVAKGLDVDAEEVLQGTSKDEVKQKLKTVTDEAMERGVFGAPTFFLGDEMYWGADRIDQIWRALERERQEAR